MKQGNSGNQFCSRLARLLVVVVLGVIVSSGEALAGPFDFIKPLAAPTSPQVPNQLTQTSGRARQGIEPKIVEPTTTPGASSQDLSGGTHNGETLKFKSPIAFDNAQLKKEGGTRGQGPIAEELNLPGIPVAITNIFNSPGFNAFATPILADPGAGQALKAAFDAGSYASQFREFQLPNDYFTDTAAMIRAAIPFCVVKKQEENASMSYAEAQEECMRDPQIGVNHPNATPDNPNPIKEIKEEENTLRLTSIFLSNEESRESEGDDMPFAKDPESKSLRDNFRLTSEAFCSIYGDVLYSAKVDPKSQFVNTQLRRITPWTCRGEDPKEYSKKLAGRDQLLKECANPVSLDVSRYCRAMYYYDLIKWTMEAQCVDFNNAAIPGPKAHQPMLPRAEQDCESGNMLTGESTCPGPWGVTRADWDRTQEDLSLPGYTFTRGTAEAFFWAYGRETPTILGGGINIFQVIGSIFKNPLGALSSAGTTLLCGDLKPTGRAEFTTVAKNWKGRHPVWVKAAMRFANARALLWTRDLTIGAWSVIQGFTSTLGMKDLSEQAKQLLTTAYGPDDEATVQKQLEWTAEILKKLEIEANLARKSGTGVVGNAR